jgi:hypothetical protein
MTFSIPWVPPTLNEYSRAHWKRQREWVHIAAAYMIAALGNDRDKLRKSEPHRVRVTIQQHRQRPVDRDNLTPKVLIDALVRLRVVDDDDEEHMEQVVRRAIVDRKAEPFTEITLDSIE